MELVPDAHLGVDLVHRPQVEVEFRLFAGFFQIAMDEPRTKAEEPGDIPHAAAVVEDRIVRDLLGPAFFVGVGEAGESFDHEGDDVAQIRVRTAAVGAVEVVDDILPVESDPEEGKAAEERRVLSIVLEHEGGAAFLEIFRIAGQEPPEKVCRRDEFVREGRQV